MKSFIVAGLLATATAYPQASSDSECASSADQKFTITTVNATETSARRSIVRRQLNGPLTMTLKDGKLTDQAGRTGYIASNYQYVFCNLYLVISQQLTYCQIPIRRPGPGRCRRIRRLWSLQQWFLIAKGFHHVLLVLVWYILQPLQPVDWWPVHSHPHAGYHD